MPRGGYRPGRTLPIALTLCWLATPARAQEPSAEAPVESPAEAPAAEAPAEAPVPPDLPNDQPLQEIAYILERVEVQGNERTHDSVVASFVPVPLGGPFDVDDPSIEGLRYRLLGTGWFDSVETRLERGSSRGKVVLVIEVVERNTLVIKKLTAGVGWSVSNVRSGSSSAGRKAQPYLGATLADLDFLGTGREMGLEFLVSPDQQGLSLQYLEPLLSVPRWSLFGRTLFTRGQEFFGGDKVFASVNCDDVREGQDCETQPPAAVVDYWRAGWHLGARRDLGVFTHLSLGYRGDFVKVPPGGIPAAASTERGRAGNPLSRAPIDFSIEPGRSYDSALTVGLSFDKRDSTATPTRGTLTSFAGDLATSLVGSDYDYVRLQATFHRWRPLPWGHVLRGGVYVGGIYGRAPFFHRFFVSDLTDLAPSRILGLNLDHRPAPNIFGLMQSGRAFDSSSGTSISQMRIEDLAARVDVEYVWPFLRHRDAFLKNADVFFLLGLYMLADPSDLRLAVPGYSGIARAPVDLTFDLGVRLDTAIGVFRIGFAKWGWLGVRGSTVGGSE